MPLSSRYKFFFNILIYVSLGFLVLYLVKSDFIDFSDFSFNYTYLIISLLLLYSGFLVSPLAWQKILRKHDIVISYRKALVSEGLPIFSKYIPGKIMIIIGRAAYISIEGGDSLVKNSSISLKAQMLSLLAALSLGLFSLLFLKGLFIYLILCLLAVILMMSALFIRGIHTFFINLLRKLPGSSFTLPYVGIKESVSAFVYYLLLWGLWGAAFVIFCYSLEGELNFLAISIFPLATALGIVAIIFPGGIGIREGVLAFLLIHAGIPADLAAIISVGSRLWYLSAEIFIFIIALFLKKKDFAKLNLKQS